MAVKIRKSQAIASLSLTPLIDVVFLLLIFFLVATRFAEEDRELDVLLPAASEAKPMIVQPKELFINIDEHGTYFVDGKTLVDDEVQNVIKLAAVNNPNQSVIIRADRRSELQYAVFVMNACNASGIYDYSLTIDGQGP